MLVAKVESLVVPRAVEDDRHRPLPGEPLIAEVVGSGVGLARDRQVALRDFEFVQESVFEYVGLVQVQIPPQTRPMISDVAQFEYGVRAQFALDAEIPALHVGRLEARIKVPDAIARQHRDRVIGRGRRGARRKYGVAEQYRTWRPEFGGEIGGIHVERDRAALIAAPSVIEAPGILAYRRYRVTGPQHGAARSGEPSQGQRTWSWAASRRSLPRARTSC